MSPNNARRAMAGREVFFLSQICEAMPRAAYNHEASLVHVGLGDAGEALEEVLGSEAHLGSTPCSLRSTDPKRNRRS